MSLTTSTLLCEASKKLRIPLVGIFFKDELDIKKPFLPRKSGVSGYIINMSNSLTPSGELASGTHWVAFCVEVENSGKSKKKLYSASYFDSFGVHPPNEVKDFIKSIGARSLYVNSKQIQNINSGWCGWFCIYFLWWMSSQVHFSMGVRLDMFADKFSKNVEKNLSILKEWIKSTGLMYLNESEFNQQ